VNLATEEYLFHHSDDDIFMLWQNEPTVVIGKNQNAFAEVQLSYARESGIHISRRMTGGGAVYHDLGNLNYTFITSTEKAGALDYAYFTAPIIRALGALGLSCSLSGRNDLECEGRKFSGNAQHAGNGRILHHGTILMDTDVSVMSAVLKVDKEKMAHRAVKSFRGRVVNLCELLPHNTQPQDLIEHIERFVMEDLRAEKTTAPTQDEIEIIRTRLASKEWIFSEKRYLTDYTVEKKKKYPFGLLKIDMTLERDVIAAIRISGDFFGNAPIEGLEQALLGQSLAALSPIDLTPYIRGMQFSELAELLKE
jgi:lipoate-protein ligase A